MMDVEDRRSRRHQLLTQLVLLRCYAPDAEAVARFVAERASLLGQLEALGGSLTRKEQYLLRDALSYGERVLTEVTQRRNDVAKQLNQIQTAKRRGPPGAASRGRLRRVI